MRIRDDEKVAALFEATVKVVNEIGFASSSVSKIAKEARISPATIYIYHKNKEDLLVSTYIDIKKDMSQAMLDNFNDSLPIRDILRNVWFNMFEYLANNLEYHKFCEQFSNSPYGDLVNKQEVEQFFEPIIKVLQHGIEQKIIKNVGPDVLSAFMFHPIAVLANPRLSQYFEPTEDEREQDKKIPTTAHKASASLVSMGYVRMILTTNFDRLVETALQEEGITADVIRTDDMLKGAIPYTHSNCIIIKLHGDYRDTRIKNTPEELSEYSSEMNKLLDRVFDEFGLII